MKGTDFAYSGYQLERLADDLRKIKLPVTLASARDDCVAALRSLAKAANDTAARMGVCPERAGMDPRGHVLLLQLPGELELRGV